MPADTVLDSWLVTTAQEALTGTFYVMLLNDSGTIDSSSNAAAIVSKEVMGNGYTRQSITFDTSGIAYNSTSQIAELASSSSVSFTASGGAIAYDGIAVWRNNKSFAARTVSGVNTSTNRLTVTAHGLSDTDPVAVTATVSVPGGLLEDTLYYVNSVDANTIELYEDADLIAIADITDSGSGTIYIRTASGDPARFYSIAPTSINAGQTKSIAITRWDFGRA